MIALNKSILLKYTLILFIGLIVEWWVIFLPPLNLSQYYAGSPLKLDGLLLLMLFVFVLIKSQKDSLKINPDASIINLTLLGTIICFLSELLFQAIRQFTVTEDRLYYFIYSTLSVTALTSIVSFFVAFQLKTKRTRILVLMIAVYAIIINLVKYMFGFAF